MRNFGRRVPCAVPVSPARIRAVIVALLAMAASASLATPRTSQAPGDETLPSMPLLREGTRLINAEGRLVRDTTTGWWVFLARTTVPQTPVKELVMLPSRTLEQMQGSLQSGSGGDVAFEVTGEVYVYRGRNFLLAQRSAQVLPSSTTPGPDARPQRPPTGDGPNDDSVEAIMQRLADAVGPLQRTAANPRPDANEGGVLIEPQEILWRRGRLRRSDEGAWLFVFDADAEGRADPPVVVLPCLLLERLEQYVARAGRTAPLLLSGRTHAYGKGVYLMPSVFRIPRERTPLTP